MIKYIAGTAAGAFAAYSIFFERSNLMLTRIELAFDRLPKAFDGFNILQLSDLHTGHWWKTEQRMEKIVQSLDVDLVVLTGDIAVSTKGARLVREYLDQLWPGNQTLAVFGNTEHKGRYGERRRADLQWPGLRVLVNEHVLIERDGQSIVVAGVDDPFSRHDDLTAALRGVTEDAFKLLIAHAPSVAGDAVIAGVDLLLSGHTHGGQIRFPLVGALYPHLRKYRRLVMGLFEGERLRRILKMDPRGLRVYVSRGIGISNLPMRFLCPPEVVLITLRSAS